MPLCHAYRSSDGEPCQAQAIKGGTVCVKHGGRAPQVRAAANRRLAAAKLENRTERRLDKLLDELEIDAAGRGPIEILLDVVYRCGAMVQLLGAVVGGLDDTQLHDDTRPHVATTMYDLWLDRASRASKMALDAGVSAQLVQMEQERTQLLAQVMRAVFADPDLALTATQRDAVPRVMGRHLRAIATG